MPEAKLDGTRDQYHRNLTSSEAKIIKPGLLNQDLQNLTVSDHDRISSGNAQRHLLDYMVNTRNKVAVTKHHGLVRPERAHRSMRFHAILTRV